jgi:predicted SAM-dependent methyltransferase
LIVTRDSIYTAMRTISNVNKDRNISVAVHQQVEYGQRAPFIDVYPAYGRESARSGFVKKAILRLIPLHVFKHLRDEVPLIALRWKSMFVRKRFRNSDNLLVNIAPGAHGRIGWVNVDVFRGPNINCLYDCRKSLPFPDESVRAIFCEHFFEHLDYTEEIPSFLSECHRVLKKNGVMRLILPDAEKYLRAYCADTWQALREIRGMSQDNRDPYFHCEYHTPIELINVLFRQGHEHKFAHDFESVKYSLQLCGFSEIRRQTYGVSWMPQEMVLDQTIRASESLYVEARK